MSESATAAPPASASPTAAPAVLPASPASTPPPAGGDQSSSSWLDEAGRDIEALDVNTPPPDTKGKGTKPDAQAKPPKPGDKPDDDKGKTTPAPDDQTPKPIRAAELRTAYDNLKKEKREVLEPKIQQLESKIKELEGRQPEDTKPLMEKMTAAEKRAAELESHIQFVDYQRSREFQEKFAQPYTEAWTKAAADFGQLTVRIPDGEDEITHEPKFKSRQATTDDLLYLANLPLTQMDEQAEALFGKSAPRVIRHVERVRELSDAQNKAVADAHKRSGEMVQIRQKQSAEMHQKQTALWTQFNKEIAERYPAMFAPAEGDTEGNTLLQKGFALADRLFAPSRENPPKSLEERVQLHALLRNKIANHDRLARANRLLKAELAEARKELEQFDKSTPPAGGSQGARPASRSFIEEANSEIERLNER